MKDNSITNIVLRDVHCPYCEKKEAIVFDRVVQKKTTLGLPSTDLKTFLQLVYNIFYIFVWGFELFTIKTKLYSVSYLFCPLCGNSCAMPEPEDVEDAIQEPKFYRIKTGKVFMGICRGISEYIELPILWVRICTGILAVGSCGLVGFIYLVVYLNTKYVEDVVNEAQQDTSGQYNGGGYES